MYIVITVSTVKSHNNKIFGKLDVQNRTQAVAMWLIAVVVISTLASIMPARSAMTISVRERLAYA